MSSWDWPVSAACSLEILSRAVPFPGSPAGLGLLHVPVVDADAVSGVAGKDVLAGVYEGGAKVWECTRDVLTVLRDRGDIGNARVLDLGCGTGMLGSAALRSGASAVTFADLNEPVLRTVTCANVCANRDSFVGPIRFIAGDWSALLAAALGQGEARIDGLGVGVFDLILGSEILYRPEHYQTLLSLLSTLLAPGGTAFIGTKRFYFGNGLRGGTSVFSQMAQEAGLAVDVCFSAGDGLKRDVLTIKK